MNYDSNKINDDLSVKGDHLVMFIVLGSLMTKRLKKEKISTSDLTDEGVPTPWR